MKKMCLVLGMGESGGSVLSGMLEILGINFPETNDFKDNLHLMTINESILTTFAIQASPLWAKGLSSAPSLRWLYPPELPPDWIKKVSPSLKTAIHKLLEDYSKTNYSGIKDARLSLFLPLYFNFIEDIEIDPKIIVVKRNFDDLATALYKHHNCKIPRESVLKTYNRYNRDIDFCTQFKDRFDVEYDELIKAPIETAEGLADFLDIPFRENQHSSILSFVDTHKY